MALSEHEASNLKEQIINQIDSTFPEDKKEAAKQQIISMNAEQFEEFLIQNNLVKGRSQQDQPKDQPQKNIFRMIVEEKVQSYKIDENSNAIAVLEINPVSKGHAIIIPKKEAFESEKIPSSAFTLSKKISKRIKTKLKPREVLISSSNVLGESVINIIPVYENESTNSPRYKAEESELTELQKKLKKTPAVKKTKPKKKKSKEVFKLPERIP